MTNKERAQIEALVQNEEKLQAVQWITKRTGMGLKEAVQYIDSIEEEKGTQHHASNSSSSLL